ncbi:MAG: histidine phosphatase family protein [Pseudomonadota bacterium]
MSSSRAAASAGCFGWSANLRTHGAEFVSSDPTTILLTRHGHVEGIEPPRFRGRADLRLTETGISQAKAVARRIDQAWRPHAIYASPLGRTLRTAEIIAEVRDVPVQPLDALIDIDYGAWQGLPVEEVKERWPEEAERWFHRPNLAQPPGGESLQEVLVRVTQALRLLANRHAGKTVVLVGHDSVNRVLLSHALDLPLTRYWQIRQAPCAISRIEASIDGFSVHSINETGHLDLD